jgi:CxxC motif-containing protein
MNKEFICIVCPRGCHISVDDNNIITGNQCKRGETYVINEMTNPKRVLTTTVKTVFKGLLYQAMEEINKIVIDKEMKIGEVVIKNILDTGVDVVLTKAVKVKEEV